MFNNNYQASHSAVSMVDETASFTEGIGKARVNVRRRRPLYDCRRHGRTEGSASRINREINYLKYYIDNVDTRDIF